MPIPQLGDVQNLAKPENYFCQQLLHSLKHDLLLLFMTLVTREIAEQLIAEQGPDVVIPDFYTSILSGAFRDNQDINSVVIPGSIGVIPSGAFQILL